jgi:hypothetical protein
MPNRLFEITVRPNWQEIDRLWAARSAELWWWAQMAVLAAVLASMLLGSLAPQWPALQVTRLAIFTLVTWAPPVWYLFQRRLDRGRPGLALAGVLAVLLGAVMVVVVTAPASTDAPGQLRLPLPFVLLAPVATWSLLLYGRRQAPATARALGLVAGNWFYYTLVGAAAGAALGFHMLLILQFLPFAPAVRLPAPATAFWLVCYVVGLRATGEELLCRGLGYHLLAGSAEPLPAVVARLTVLNMLLFLIPLAHATHPALWLLSLVYGALLAVATTLLRYRFGSLVPALACNAVFALFVATVLPW